MGCTWDADGPPRPTSTRSRSYAGSVVPSYVTGSTTSSGRSSGNSLVEDPFYRVMDLSSNNIYIHHPCDPVPEHIASLVDHVRRDRDSPGRSLDQLRQDTELYDLWMGPGKPQVVKHFQTIVFPDPKQSDSLNRTDSNPMAKHTVPDAGSKLKVSTPVPDMLYGYNRLGAFTDAQRAQLISMGAEMIVNNQHLIYPFFVIEFKADGPSENGSLSVATNQCLGVSTSCCYHERHRGEALHFVEAYKRKYYMASVDSFLLQKPNDYLEFRKYTLNIIDWGKDKRLKDIRHSLDNLLEEGRRRTSGAAKSNLPAVS